jgi:PAS domain S-box-containing protein
MQENWEEYRRRIIGLGESSMKKSYYPELQKKIEDLEENQKNLNAIVSSISDGIVIHNQKGEIISLNKRAQELFNLNDNEVSHYSLLNLHVDGCNYSELIKIWENVVNGNHIEIDWCVKQAHTASEIFVQLSLNKIFWNNKHAIIAVVRDFTERKKFEKQLIEAREKAEKSEERYNIAMTAVNEAIWDWNVKESLTYFDSRYYTIAGYEPNEFPSDFNEWIKRVHKDDIDECLTTIENTVVGKTENFEIEFRFVRKNGDWMWLRGKGKIVERDENGKVARMIGTHTDITDKKNLEIELIEHKENLELLVKERTEELEAANEELVSINEELFDQRNELETTLERLHATQNQLIQSEKMASIGILTAGIAHEINNPVNFISSGVVGLELLTSKLIAAIKEYVEVSRTIGNEETDRLLIEIDTKYDVRKSIENISNILKAIQTGVERTTAIVKGLRTFSRMDNETKTTIKVSELINSTLTILFNKYKNRIEIQTTFEANDEILCFPGKLGQLLLNIILNAIQAIEANGIISIETLRNDKKNIFTIKVYDNGKGMPVEILKKIFDPFFTTKPVGQGTGLGLSLVHGIINDHNGDIKVKSSEGKGTEFTITLPIN